MGSRSDRTGVESLTSTAEVAPGTGTTTPPPTASTSSPQISNTGNQVGGSNSTSFEPASSSISLPSTSITSSPSTPGSELTSSDHNIASVPIRSPTLSSTLSTSSSSSGNSTGIGREPSASSGSSSGLSSGAIAGIAIGAAAALLLALILFIFWRKRRRTDRDRRPSPPRGQNQQDYSPPRTGGEGLVEKPTFVQGTWYPRPSSPETEVLLPQQADDATVQSRFSTLYDQIELHIENFYKDSSPVIPPATEGALSRYDTPFLSSPLAAYLEGSPRVTTILKHVLSYEITMTAVTPMPGRRGLLPAEILSALHEVQIQQQQQEASGYQASPSLAYTHLKQTAARFRSSPQSGTSSAVHDSAVQFSRIFSLWADPKFEEAYRAQHLTEVINTAVTFAIWLLSHPEQFELRWGDDSSGGNHSLVTVPELVKVTGQGGKILGRGEEKVLSEVIWRRI